MPIAPIPEGFGTLTPAMIVAGAAQAIDLYAKAFGAKETFRATCPNSDKIMHACVQIGSSRLFLSDVNPEMGCGTPTVSNFYVYIDNVDVAARQAKQAGLQETSPVKDMFWGDRTGNFKDRFGNNWTLATHVRDVSPQEIEEAKKKFAAKAA